MSRVLPILFNTEMVRAILDGRKTVTRRIIKGFIPADAIWGYTFFTPKGCISCRGTFADGYGEKFFKLPYQPGNTLYVRETYKRNMDGYSGIDFGGYIYKADCSSGFKDLYNPWHPSIHMPKEAARIWLKVTDVRAERLQDITFEGCLNEGAFVYLAADGLLNKDIVEPEAKKKFSGIWDSTLKKSDLGRYGWNANPWVWVIEFERCEKPLEIFNMVKG